MDVAYSYLRFSSPSQAKGDSLRRQIMLRDAYCERHGLKLDDTLTLRDLGVSAYRGANTEVGALAGFLDACRNGRVVPGSTLLVEKLDRISRQEAGEATALFLQIINAGVIVVTLEPEREYKQGAANEFQLLEVVLHFVLAHLESKKKSERVHEAWEEKRRKAAKSKTPMTEKCPEWLRLDEGGYRPIEAAAAAIRRVFELCIEGAGIRRIVNILEQEGVQAFGRSGRWTMPYISKILRWKAVIGEYQPHVLVHEKGKKQRREPHGDPVPGYYPAIIQEADFYRAQQMRAGRRYKPGRASCGETNLFTGLLYHAEHRRTMVLKRDQPGTKYVYLQSSAYQTGTRPGPTGIFPYQPLEDAVLGILKELKPQDVLDASKVAGSKEVQSEIAAAELQLRQIEQTMEKARARPKTPETIDVYMETLEALARDRKATIRQLEQLRAKATSNAAESLTETQSLVDMFKNAKGQEQAKLRLRIRGKLGTIINQIWVLIEANGQRQKRVFGQVFLQNGEMRQFRIIRPLPKPGTPLPRLRPELESVDLRNYTSTNRSTSADGD